MNFLKLALRRIRSVFTTSALDRDMDNEVRLHLDLLIEEYECEGMSPEEARRAASRRFGNVLQIKERGHDVRGAGILGDVLRDVRYGLHSLRRTPAFTATVVLTLALGIGANTAIFSIVDRLLLRPLPYPQGEQLVMVYESLPEISTPRASVSPANWMDWRKYSQSFESLAAWNTSAMTLTSESGPERLNGQVVSVEFFPLMRVRPLIGRVFTEAEDRPDAQRVVVLAHRFWQRKFGGDLSVIGNAIEMDGARYEVIGVMPPDFQFVSQDTDYWTPYALDRNLPWRESAGRFINIVGRLKSSTTPAKARTEMEGIARQLEQTYAFNKGSSITVVSLRDVLTGEVRQSLFVLFATVGMLVLIACFNVASMLLARFAFRRREIAIRVSLGAASGRIFRQLILESLLLSTSAGLVGVVLARVLVAVLLSLVPASLMPNTAVPLDAWVLAYALSLSTCTGLIFGVAPALAGSRMSGTDYLRGTGRSTMRSGRLRQGLVVGQIALTVVLLCGAGLLLRSLTALLGTRTGMDAGDVLTMQVGLPGRQYDGVRRTEFFRQAAERIRSLPGVQSVGASFSMPVIGASSQTVAHVRGTPAIFRDQNLNDGLRVSNLKSEGTGTSLQGGLLPRVRVVTAGYFRTLGIPLLLGREFEWNDQLAQAPLAFVVNEAFVKKYLSGRDPLDTSISVLMSEENPYGRIIGVVGDVIEGSLRQGAEPTVFYGHGNHGQLPVPAMTLFVRSNRGTDLADTSIGVIHELDKNQPVTRVRMLEDVLNESVARERLTALVSLAFAVTALLLAALGIYGLLAYLVAERTKEIGIRMALGAEPSRMLWSVMRQGMVWVAWGSALGLAGAFAVSRVITSLLFEVSANDPTTWGVVILVLMTVSALASFLPACRATRIHPMVALRQD